MDSPVVNIIKSSGERVPFSKQKLHDSLKRSGASEQIINGVIKEVESLLHEGIDTRTIFRMAFKLLKKQSKHTAAKYKLKEAIMELGPSGFPFEKFISEILKHQGFKTNVGEIVKGKCVNHEIDVIAQKDDKHFMIECKYHNERGINCNVKIPLYIKARFEDIEPNWKSLPGHEGKFHQGWVITNTRFSSDAIQYGLCAGLHLVSWDFPKNGSLKDQINFSGLFPITCMTTLTIVEKQKLLDKNVVLCLEIFKNPEWLMQIGISPDRSATILKEAQAICEVIENTNDKKNDNIQ